MANEPVAWHYPDGKPDQCTTDKAYAEKKPAWTPMYYKHEWVGLTDEEVNSIYEAIEKVVGEHWDNGGTKLMFPVTLYEALEAKLREKNT